MKSLETTNDECQRLGLIIETDVREIRNGIQLLGLIVRDLLEAGTCRVEGDARVVRRICRPVLAMGTNVPPPTVCARLGLPPMIKPPGIIANGGLL